MEKELTEVYCGNGKGTGNRSEPPCGNAGQKRDRDPVFERKRDTFT